MNKNGRFGEFGGQYVPEILLPTLVQLEQAYLDALQDAAFNAELQGLLKDYAGRPTPLYLCRNLCASSKAKIYLKREDLLHGGAHKTNQVIAQALLAKRMEKTHLIAETGAGQHGVATAMAGALLGLKTRIYMGAKDCDRQALNVFRMELMGAEVIAVKSGSQTLKDAVNEALRDWSASYQNTHYLLGTVAGPHPFPIMVRDFQKIIGEEARAQIIAQEGRLPHNVLACVGGGSNAIGIFHAFQADEQVALTGVEPAGHGLHTNAHGAALQCGRPGILHGAYTYLLQDKHGQINEAHSISAGLDYPAVGPEHAWLQATGRANYVGITDQEALDAFSTLSKAEGIIPALESAHAIAYAIKLANQVKTERLILVNLSGRGDKDMTHVRSLIQNERPNIDATGA